MATSLRADFQTLYRFMTSGRRRQLGLLILLMPATALAEMVMVATIIPFISLLAGGIAPSGTLLGRMIELIERLSPESPLLAAAGLFAMAALLTATLRLTLSSMSQQFAFGFGHELAVEIQRRLLHQPYLFHVQRHSSDLLASLGKVDHLTFNLLLQGIQAVSSFLIALFVLAILVRIDPVSAILAAGLVGGLYGVALAVARKRLEALSSIIGTAYERRLKAVHESIGGIRDVIIDRSQLRLLERFREIDGRFTRAQAEAAFLASAPRFLVESLGLILIALLAGMIAERSGGLVGALPILGALTLGAQRLLPLMSQLYGGWASLVTSRPIVSEVAALISLPTPPLPELIAPVPFNEAIRLDGVGFHYPDREHAAVLNITMVIPKGQRIAITGRTGAGKSTLADLLMGLIEPSQGQLSVDGQSLSGQRLVAWRQSIAHVPQTIFLADASIASNIALSTPGSELDMNQVRHAAEAAQLSEFIETLTDGYETSVGERGVRLSGGQRQRLALARAICKRAPLLVLDEATSALDDATEAAVLTALDELHAEGCTILIIAHRLSTVARCDQVFVLEEGALIRAGSYNELFGQLRQLQDQGEL